MAGYNGPNNRRYEKHYKWWLRFTMMSATVGAVWGWLHFRRRA
jgi:hypothetical protein